MIHFEKTLDIDAPQEKVWAVIADFMKVDEFAPFVTNVDALSDNENGMGAKRRCHFDNGTSLVEEIIEWDEGTYYKVKLSEFGSIPFVASDAVIKLETLSNGKTKVIWGIGYKIKYSILGWLLGQTIMKKMMGKVIIANLKGLADKVNSNKTAAA